MKVCTCAYQKCVDYGWKPINHSPTCPMFNKIEVNLDRETKRFIPPKGDNPFIGVNRFKDNKVFDEWVKDDDQDKYNKCYEKNIKSWTLNKKKISKATR